MRRHLDGLEIFSLETVRSPGVDKISAEQSTVVEMREGINHSDSSLFSQMGCCVRKKSFRMI